MVIDEHRNALVERVLQGPGTSSPAQRRAAFDNEGLAEPARSLVEKVAKHAYKVTDEDVAAVKQAVGDEDQVFELVVCAAIGQATRQLESALAALAEAEA